jgi:hypothetical protein
MAPARGEQLRRWAWCHGGYRLPEWSEAFDPVFGRAGEILDAVLRARTRTANELPELARSRYGSERSGGPERQSGDEAPRSRQLGRAGGWDAGGTLRWLRGEAGVPEAFQPPSSGHDS